MSVTSPDWLTQLGRLWGGKSVSRGIDHCTSEPEAIARAAECSSLHMRSLQTFPPLLCRMCLWQMQRQRIYKSSLAGLYSKRCTNG